MFTSRIEESEKENIISNKIDKIIESIVDHIIKDEKKSIRKYSGPQGTVQRGRRESTTWYEHRVRPHYIRHTRELFEEKYEEKKNKLKEIEAEGLKIRELYLSLRAFVERESLRRKEITDKEIIAKFKEELRGLKALDFGISLSFSEMKLTPENVEHVLENRVKLGYKVKKILGFDW